MIGHDSDCALHNEPAYPNGSCDCSVSRSPTAGDEGRVREIAKATAIEIELFVSKLVTHWVAFHGHTEEIGEIVTRAIRSAALPAAPADGAVEALRGLVKAWNSLPTGDHSKAIVEAWLLHKMKPAIEAAREALLQADTQGDLLKEPSEEEMIYLAQRESPEQRQNLAGQCTLFICGAERSRTDALHDDRPWFDALIKHLKSCRASLTVRPPSAPGSESGAEEKHEREMLALIDERDAAEQSLGQAYYIVTAQSPEWPNRFGHEEALEEIGDAIAALKAVAKEAVVITAPLGWQLVPKEPTEEWARRYGTSGNRCLPWGHAAQDIRDMLAASPSPGSPVAGDGDRETLQTILDLINPLHGKLDNETYDDKMKMNFDAPRDAEYSVIITAGEESDLTQAVCILEDRLRPLPNKGERK